MKQHTSVICPSEITLQAVASLPEQISAAMGSFGQHDNKYRWAKNGKIFSVFEKEQILEALPCLQPLISIVESLSLDRRVDCWTQSTPRPLGKFKEHDVTHSTHRDHYTPSFPQKDGTIVIRAAFTGAYTQHQKIFRTWGVEEQSKAQLSFKVSVGSIVLQTEEGSGKKDMLFSDGKECYTVHQVLDYLSGISVMFEFRIEDKGMDSLSSLADCLAKKLQSQVVDISEIEVDPKSTGMLPNVDFSKDNTIRWEESLMTKIVKQSISEKNLILHQKS